jgi:hypothetical protein
MMTSSLEASNSGATASGDGTRAPPSGRRYNARRHPAHIVARPVPAQQSLDPRTFQLSQLRRRFRPAERTLPDGGLALDIKLAPSDPDFPFEMPALDCVMTVPQDYPTSRPSVRVNNKEMGRGYQINVERGFDDIVDRNRRGTLLQYMNSLDKELETLLAAPKAETVRLVIHSGKGKTVQPSAPESSVAQNALISQYGRPSSPKQEPVKSYSMDELQKAKAKRSADTRQLEARLGRLPLFAKSIDGLSYTVPIDPRSSSELPPSLQAMKTVRVIVPEKYNLEPCRIEIPGDNSEAAIGLQQNFELWVSINPDVPLVARINYLAQNMHTMAKTKTPDEKVSATPPMDLPESSSSKAKGTNEATLYDRGHIKVIPRPPEWSAIHDEDSDDDSSPFESSDDSGEDTPSENESDAPVLKQENVSHITERGIMISFPHLELYSIELLELVTLNITVKCDRCKDLQDVTNLKNNEKADYTGEKSFSCKKCSSKLSAGKNTVAKRGCNGLMGANRLSNGSHAYQLSSRRLH